MGDTGAGELGDAKWDKIGNCTESRASDAQVCAHPAPTARPDPGPVRAGARHSDSQFSEWPPWAEGTASSRRFYAATYWGGPIRRDLTNLLMAPKEMGHDHTEVPSADFPGGHAFFKRNTNPFDFEICPRQPLQSPYNNMFSNFFLILEINDILLFFKKSPKEEDCTLSLFLIWYFFLPGVSYNIPKTHRQPSQSWTSRSQFLPSMLCEDSHGSSCAGFIFSDPSRRCPDEAEMQRTNTGTGFFPTAFL